ncbi:hypothetical protein, partial [Cellvibrio sp.]
IYFHLTHGDFLQHRGLTLICILSIVIAPAENASLVSISPVLEEFQQATSNHLQIRCQQPRFSCWQQRSQANALCIGSLMR